MDIASDYGNGDSVTYTTSRGPGLPKHMCPPFDKTEYRPGTGAQTLFNQFLSGRKPRFCRPRGRKSGRPP